MTDKKQEQDSQKVVPVQPPKVTINIPPAGKTPVNSTSIPSSGTVTPLNKIITEMEKAAKEEIIPPPQEPERPEQEQNE